MLRKLFLPLIAISLIFWGIGCSDSGTATDESSGEVNLNEDFGGYTISSEEPAFDNPELMNTAAGDEDYDDPIALSPSVDSLINNDESGYYHLRIVWGQLCYDSSITEITDWSGSLSITRGAEVIRRVIRFEPEQDYILERTDRKLIEWVSYTTVHNDGIGVDIIIPPVLPVFDTSVIIDTITEGETVETIIVDTTYPDPEPVEVTFATGPYTNTFSLAEISTLDTIVYLEDSSAIAFHGLKIDHRPCPRGFLTGFWGYDEEGNGVFEGVWMSQFGFVTGFVKGSYGENEEGEKVFFGKWISRDGTFEGLLKGYYGLRPNYHANFNGFRHGGGWFKGNIFSEDHIEIGVLKGKFNSSSNSVGFFQGKWKINCAEEAFITDKDLENTPMGDGF